MSLNSTPSGERTHIAFFGLRNAGKSSLVNAVTGQSLSVVSDVPGTTTDPVRKAMELLPIGPVVIIDTPGIDDEGKLGEKRVEKAKEILNKADVAVLVHDCTKPIEQAEDELLAIFKERQIPYVLVYSKSDKMPGFTPCNKNELAVSSTDNKNIYELKELIGKTVVNTKDEKVIIRDLLNPLDHVLLVIPIDKAAPKGRLILPQQMVIRDILDAGCTVSVARESELENALSELKNPPKLVVTDSQVFGLIAPIVPKDVMLTSFSILMARYKGDLSILVEGAKALENIKDGDKILISEGCTHHRQCNDIGTVKMPAWVEKFTGKKVEYDFTSGGEFPNDLSKYSLVIHCGACMLNEREMQSRIKRCLDQNVPIVNYGVAIAHMHGILKRSLEIFPSIHSII